MRIGINCLPLNDKIGGLRQYFQRLVYALFVHDKVNSYFLFHSQENAHELEFIGNDLSRWNTVQVMNYGDLFSKLANIDVYFCPFAILWPRPLPVPCVVNLSDIQEVYYPQFFCEAALLQRKNHFAFSTRFADSVLTVSEFSKHTIIENHGIRPDKIYVAYHSADESMFVPPQSDVLEHLHLPDRFVFYPATHWLHKNHDALLRALLHLRSAYGCKIHCVFTGQETDNGYPLKDKIAEYGINDQVRLLGYVTNEEIRALFHRATMLCFPSLYEGFGLPLVDAMAAGCPITCSNAASIPEVVNDAALIFDPNNHEDVADKIYTLWNNRKLCEELVAKGRKRVNKFAALVMVKVHLEAFQSAFDISDLESKKFYEDEVWEPLKKYSTILEKFSDCEIKLKEIQGSLSWRITKPLRTLGDWIRKCPK